MTDTTIKFQHFLFLWFGAAVSIAEILAGGLLAPLGFFTGVMAILVGHIIGTLLLVLGGLIGSKERIPAIESTRISFGKYGSCLFSILNIIQLLGWTAVMIITASKSVNEITKMIWQIDNIPLWSLFIGGLILIWLGLGREGGWKKINMAAVFLLFSLTVVLSALVFNDVNTLFQSQQTDGMTFSEGVELSVIMPLSWLPLIADYTRFAQSDKKAAWGSGLGYFIGSCWMYIIGLAIGIISGSADPSSIMLAANLGLSAMGIIILATVTTTFMDAYSAGVSFTNLIYGLNEKYAALVMTVIGILLALVVDMEQYEDFLLAIGSVFAPLFSILFTDYFILRNRTIYSEMRINWGGLAIWALGVVLYYQILKLDMIMGTTIPVMLITAILYAFSRYAGNWICCDKSL